MRSQTLRSHDGIVLVERLEMSTDGRTLNVSAYDGESKTSLELVIKEKVHRQLYRECNGDYAQIAAMLRVDGSRLILDSPLAQGG
ncbi:unnamed protein product [Cladocopium goreaui]|uniref:Uncharacterized protein n=1 Tax=Cladocopium goreaui TaxID=2562237 RepID=A0A9P1GH56_9DINO|nr:unnamed protein product [Cladocopium goreaui]